MSPRSNRNHRQADTADRQATSQCRSIHLHIHHRLHSHVISFPQSHSIYLDHHPLISQSDIGYLYRNQLNR